MGGLPVILPVVLLDENVTIFLHNFHMIFRLIIDAGMTVRWSNLYFGSLLAYIGIERRIFQIDIEL